MNTIQYYKIDRKKRREHSQQMDKYLANRKPISRRKRLLAQGVKKENIYPKAKLHILSYNKWISIQPTQKELAGS